jgi:uncharacterized FAD-dependent dehydrogenase
MQLIFIEQEKKIVLHTTKQFFQVKTFCVFSQIGIINGSDFFHIFTINGKKKKKKKQQQAPLLN